MAPLPPQEREPALPLGAALRHCPALLLQEFERAALQPALMPPAVLLPPLLLLPLKRRLWLLLQGQLGWLADLRLRGALLHQQALRAPLLLLLLAHRWPVAEPAACQCKPALLLLHR